MSNIEHTVATFERPFVPFLYDLLVKSIYLPVGGEGRLRRSAVAQLAPRGGERVLELGCGTGSFTRLLLAAGASVTSVDGSTRMLERARRKAPGATFRRADLQVFRGCAEETYDTVFFGFVLHELSPETRQALLEAAARCLEPNGRIVIVDHAVPETGRLARAWRGFLQALEPPSVREVLRRGYEAELCAAGFPDIERSALGRGTACLLIARRGAP